MKLLLAVACAGALGTLCRYGVTLLPWTIRFPCATLFVNLLGALLAGFLYAWLNARFPDYARCLPVLFIGFFGAFTTFSTLMLDVAKMLDAGQVGLAMLDLLAQTTLGLVCAWGGMLIGKQLA
ncbi:MAG: fluoride efflux transporter FluC [Oligosphaeraceae bacterium]